MEWCTRSWGVHAAGVIMSKQSLDTVIPLVDNDEGVILTGFCMSRRAKSQTA